MNGRHLAPTHPGVFLFFLVFVTPFGNHKEICVISMWSFCINCLRRRRQLCNVSTCVPSSMYLLSVVISRHRRPWPIDRQPLDFYFKSELAWHSRILDTRPWFLAMVCQGPKNISNILDNRRSCGAALSISIDDRQVSRCAERRQRAHRTAHGRASGLARHDERRSSSWKVRQIYITVDGEIQPAAGW